MVTDTRAATAGAVVEERVFAGRRVETTDVLASLTVEAQAALRQFSLERTVAYGVDVADAVELRARVLDGQSWQASATAIAEVCAARANTAPADMGGPTRVAYLRRASALLRISQVMMLTDTDERRRIFVDAADLYGRAAAVYGDRERFAVQTADGTLSGWLLAAGDGAVGSALVVGGVEGWAMDFDSVGAALAERGIHAFLLDGPGQGVSRFEHRVSLTAGWLEAYRRVVDEIESRVPDLPVGVVGNSMGGSFAMTLAAADRRIAACCDNGGVPAPGRLAREPGTFARKMTAFCGDQDVEQAVAIWSSVDPSAPGPNAGYPLLIVHGRRDPLVTDESVDAIIRSVPTDDLHVVTFSDGVHCLYNHRQDRDVLIADWVRLRLGQVPTSRG